MTGIAADRAPETDDDVVGVVIGGRYRVLALAGRGGMGAVYRARDESLGRDVALKILRSSPDDAAAASRERSEVALLASLNHRALVTLFDASEFAVGDETRTCLVMEFVDGPTLGDRIRAGVLAGADVAVMVADLAEALSVVHARGVVHRDIKPANILLGASQLPGQEFSARLADFGIAYLVDSTRLTQAGTLIGTAAYLSPEQATGAEPTAAADIYSLGLVILEALTRRREFEGTMIESVSARLARDPVVPSWLGEEWRSLLVAMTVRDAEKRPTALEVAVLAKNLPEPGTIAEQSTAPMEASAPAPTLVQTAVYSDAAPTAVYSDASPTAAYPDAAPTAKFPASVETEVIERGEPFVAAPAVAPRAPSRVRLVITIAAVLAIVIIVAVAIAGGLGRGSTEPEAVPSLPAVEGELGTHLQELFDRAGE